MTLSIMGLRGDREMTEFDKWNTKQPRELPSLEERKHSPSLIDAVRKQGWIGALEWVMNTRYRDTDVPVYNLIIEELRGKGDRK